VYFLQFHKYSNPSFYQTSYPKMFQWMIFSDKYFFH